MKAVLLNTIGNPEVLQVADVDRPELFEST
jgi:NADPH:quinone reductase-like Zn-dependent oxidoreductase